MSVLKNNALKWAGYSGYFSACFLIACYLTFPYGRVRDWLQEQVKKQGGGIGTSELQIGELAPSWVTGVELADVRYIRSKPSDPTPTVIEFDELTVRISALAALLGNVSVSFSGEGRGGTVEGNFSEGDGERALEASFAELDMSSLGLSSVAGLPVKGSVTGEVDVVIPADIKGLVGKVNLGIGSLAIGDGTAKLKVPGMRQGFTLERIDAGKLQLEAEAADGVIELKKLEGRGDDISLDASGTVKLASKLDRSRMDLTIEAAFSDAYKKRDDKTKALFELMNFQRKVQQALTPAGAFRYKIGGTVSVPRATPAGKGGPSTTGSRRAPKTQIKAGGQVK